MYRPDATRKELARRRARRQLRRLKLPEQAPKVLNHHCYRTPELCELFCQACDRWLLQDPDAGLAMAMVAAQLVQTLPESTRKRQLRVQALSILGSAQRAVGELEEAETAFQRAFDSHRLEAVDSAGEADLLRRHAALLVDQDELEGAALAAQRSVELLTPAAPGGEADHRLGAALVQRGIVALRRERLDTAIDDFGLALGSLDPKRDERVYDDAIRHLALSLRSTPDLGQINRALGYLSTARAALQGRRGSLARNRLLWAESALQIRLGATRRAEKGLLRARAGFVRLGSVSNLVLVSLELAILYRGQGQLEELRHLARETLDECRRLGAGRKALGLLRSWQRAVREDRATIDALETISRELERLLPD